MFDFQCKTFQLSIDLKQLAMIEIEGQSFECRLGFVSDFIFASCSVLATGVSPVFIYHL